MSNSGSKMASKSRLEETSVAESAPSLYRTPYGIRAHDLERNKEWTAELNTKGYITHVLQTCNTVPGKPSENQRGTEASIQFFIGPIKEDETSESNPEFITGDTLTDDQAEALSYLMRNLDEYCETWEKPWTELCRSSRDDKWYNTSRSFKSTGDAMGVSMGLWYSRQISEDFKLCHPDLTRQITKLGEKSKG
ncbi:uncharacterized protein L201_001364 [Kwoniella dendrophila CBS 6074]|uniref:Uncharacterized protein n=1 Tax=Kwoniella dendrophila CBS 6074 TaxID=1295534 RepID=A0AAX4JNT7_9TREE